MKSVHLFMDAGLLMSLDEAVRIGRTRRSALIRRIVEERLRGLLRPRREVQCMEAYRRRPAGAGEHPRAALFALGFEP